jgi:Zn-dependent peptidase ImmA (M78 family)
MHKRQHAVIEREANIFAAGFLVPLKTLKAAFSAVPGL